MPQKLGNLSQPMSHPVVDFKNMYREIGSVTEDFTSKLTNAKEFDVKIKKLIEEIAVLEKEMKRWVLRWIYH